MPAGGNYGHYKNDKLDELFSAGRGTTDQAQRKKIYTEAATIMNEELPWIYLWSPNSIFAHSKKLVGFKAPSYATHNMWNADEWTVSGQIASAMGKYLLRRLVISVPVLLGITLVVYVIVSLAPGDPGRRAGQPGASRGAGPDFLAQQREALGLNDPILVRYAIWLRELGRGNLGFSFMDRQPIAAKIGERLWPTLRLMLTAQLIAICIAVPGVMSALKQYSLLDYGATVLGFAAISVPSFFLSLAGHLRVRAEDPDPAGGRDGDGRAGAVAGGLALASGAAGHGAGPRRGGPADPLHPIEHARGDPPGYVRVARAKGCASGR